jgi:hypothetical protein
VTSPALLLASVALALSSAALISRAAVEGPEASQLEAVYDLTPQQARWIADGVPSNVALGLHPSCDVTVNIAREFPVIVSCPDEVQP